MQCPKVFPVIHYLNRQTTVVQAALAFEAGADGVFLISHNGVDRDMLDSALRLKRLFPGKPVGLNYLFLGIEAAALDAARAGLDMVWGDNCGVSSRGLTPDGRWLRAFRKRTPSVEVFAGVAFKYQPEEHAPYLAALEARAAGFVPTTSGPATGSPPTVHKVKLMAASGQAPCLAVASGMSIDNVRQFAPWLSHILVASSVSKDDHHFDYELLRAFIGAARAGGQA